MRMENSKSELHEEPISLRSIATLVFIDLETSGTCNQKITELGMVAVSTEHFLDMQKKRDEPCAGISTPHQNGEDMENGAPGPPTKRANPFQHDEEVRSVKRKLFDIDVDNMEEKVEDMQITTNKNIEGGKEDATTPACRQITKKSTNRAPEIPRVLHKMLKAFNPWTTMSINTEGTGLSNILLEKCPKVSKQFCLSFKNFLDLPKPICLVAHNGNKFDFPIIVSEFLNASDCEYKFDDLYCVDSLDIVRLLDKLEVADEHASECDKLWEHTHNEESSSSSTPSKQMITFPDNASLLEKVNILKHKKDCNIRYRKKDLPYSQPNLYRRLFNETYNAHRAEDDCIALLQVCGFYGTDFLNIADLMKQPMSEINPMWISNKILHSINFNPRWRNRAGNRSIS